MTSKASGQNYRPAFRPQDVGIDRVLFLVVVSLLLRHGCWLWSVVGEGWTSPQDLRTIILVVRSNFASTAHLTRHRIPCHSRV